MGHTFGGMRVESARRVTKLIVKAAGGSQRKVLAQNVSIPYNQNSAYLRTSIESLW